MLQRDIWNNFILENNGLFLQSWEWGYFQESLGRKVWRLGDCENWSALIIKYDLPMGKNYLYCPAGPVVKLKIKKQIAKIMQDFIESVKVIAQEERSIFLRVEPFWERNSENLGVELLMRSSTPKLKKAYGGQRISKTLILDLNKSEEELLIEMKQKTRYNIRLAEKHGVKIRSSSEPEKDIELFWQLARETAKRDGFDVHPKEHYEKLLFIGHSRPASVILAPPHVIPAEAGIQYRMNTIENSEILQVKLFLAEYQNKIIASNIVVFFGNRAIYLHGASSNEHRNLMAPYLLQWEQVKEAKKQGYEIYDFWGINEKKWPGVTRFKKGFGGKEIDYCGTYDFVFNRMWYGVYKIAKRVL